MEIKKIIVSSVVIFCVVFALGILWYRFIHVSASPFDLKALEHKQNLVPLAIIGSGPAGLSAALYGVRLGVHTVVFQGPKPGGQLTETGLVENWPAVGRAQGPAIMENMQKYVASLGAIIVPETIAQVDTRSWPYQLVTDDGQVCYALGIIIATGAAPRVLNIPGERTYWGKGVTTCALCDAPYYKNKDVIVVGGGDSACEQALELAPHARTVRILVRSSRVRASVSMQRQVRALPNVTILLNKEIKEISGDGKQVTHVRVIDHAQKTVRAQEVIEVLPTAGVFLAIGHEPRTACVKNSVKLRADGSIMVQGRGQETSVSGIFAAGDVQDMIYRQAGVAAGDGIKAAVQAVHFLQSIGWNAAYAQRFDVLHHGMLFNPGARVPAVHNTGASVHSIVRALTSITQFEREVLTAQKPVIIDFYAKHCPSCMHMVPLYESVAQQFAGKLLFYKVDTQAVPALEERLKVERIPCFVVFNRGVQVARYHAIMSRPEMLAFVRQFSTSASK